MRNQTTHYDTIGVKQDATQDEIRKAYLSHAKALHPDKTGGDKEAENKLKEINAAYDILKDKKKREEYDLSLNPESLYNHVFGGAKHFSNMAYEMFMRKHDRFSPQHRKIIVQISLEEAYTGIDKEIKYEFLIKCEECQGKGGKNFKQCLHCSGSGMIHMTSGIQQISRTCPHCKGQGGWMDDKCDCCSGTGIITTEKVKVINIPKGVDTNMFITIPGEGIFGGDLVIIIEVLPHPIFKRNGPDIASELDVPLTIALLGGRLKTKSLKGEIEVTVPPEIDNGHKLRLKTLGMPIGDTYGDHYLFLKVTLPKNLTNDAKKLVKDLDKLT